MPVSGKLVLQLAVDRQITLPAFSATWEQVLLEEVWGGESADLREVVFLFWAGDPFKEGQLDPGVEEWHP